nr:hypothetical protein Iba_chr01cCG16510 [Ipomoea batatas]
MPLLVDNFELISSIRDVNSSIRSLSVEICSERRVMAPWLATAGESGVLTSYLLLFTASFVSLLRCFSRCVENESDIPRLRNFILLSAEA